MHLKCRQDGTQLFVLAGSSCLLFTFVVLRLVVDMYKLAPGGLPQLMGRCVERSRGLLVLYYVLVVTTYHFVAAVLYRTNAHVHARVHAVWLGRSFLLRRVDDIVLCDMSGQSVVTVQHRCCA